MKNLTENMKIEALRNAGYDMDKYDYAELVVLTPKEMDDAKNIVEDKQLDNKKLFRRWVTAQTFRMLNSKSYNVKTKRWEYGWDAYLRNNYAYQYQFTMMLEELRVMNKLAARDKDAFKERAHFFKKSVVIATCNDYIAKLRKYIEENAKTEVKTHYKSHNEKTIEVVRYVYIKGYGKIYLCAVDGAIFNNLLDIIKEMKCVDSYAELYTLLKMFMSKMIKLPFDTPKCKEWKDAFKGIGAYETLKNLILFHDVLLRDCTSKARSFEKLQDCLPKYDGEGWRFHAMLKDTIKLNNFDLQKSIAAHK